MGFQTIEGQDNLTNSIYRAAVDQFNRLNTFSTVQEQESHASSQGQSFTVTTGQTNPSLTVPNAFSGIIKYLKNNDSQKNAAIQSFIISCDTAGVIVQVIKSPTIGTTANVETAVYVNNNYGAGGIANAEGEVWDEVAGGITGLVGGVTNKSILTAAGVVTMQVKGAIKLVSGDVLAINVINNTGGAAEISVDTDFFYEF